MKNRISLLIITFLLAGILFLAPSAVNAEDLEVHLSADRLEWSEDGKTVTMAGNVKFRHLDTALSGRRATFNMATKIGRVEGGVAVTQPGTRITADDMIIYYDKKTVKLRDNVKIVTTKNVYNSAGKQADRTSSAITTLTCSRLEYDWVRLNGYAKDRVVVSQKTRRAFSDLAHYNGVSEVITLSGRVRFEQGSGNWLTCSRAIIDMQKETFSAAGGVRGSFIVTIKEGKPETTSMASRIPDKIVLPDTSFIIKDTP